MGILNVATYVTVDGQYVNVLEMNQYQNKIRFLQLTGTSGTLTSQQINLLRSDNTNYIIVDNELYKCNNLQDANGDLVYTHTGADTSNNVNIKTLSITLTNNNWSIQTTPVQPKIPVANTNEAVQFAESERQKSKNLLNIPNASSYTTNGVTLTIENNIITLNGTTTGFTTFIRPHQLISTNVGKYAFSFKHISGTISGNSGAMSLYNQVGKNEIYYPNTSVINDITEVTDYNQLRIAISGNITFNNFKYSLQYEQGDIATDYQPYNGAIVHEKQLPKITTLWTNPNPSNDFSSQTITLANDNYDYAIMICTSRTNELDIQISFFFEKGTTPILNYVLTNEDATYAVENMCRRVYHTNNTQLNIQDCYYSLKSNAAIVGNNLLIPYKVIGIKIGE